MAMIICITIPLFEPINGYYEIGKKLSVLREEGVLIIGSGNIVHNLHAYAWGKRNVAPYEWAVRFENQVRKLLTARKDGQLVKYEKLGDDAMLSVPTPDHYLPLLYIAALRRKNESVSFPVQGFDGGSISMLAVQVG